MRGWRGELGRLAVSGFLMAREGDEARQGGEVCNLPAETGKARTMPSRRLEVEIGVEEGEEV